MATGVQMTMTDDGLQRAAVEGGPSEGHPQAEVAASVGPTITIKDGSVATSGSVAIEGSAGWAVHQSQAVEQQAPSLSFNDFMSGRLSLPSQHIEYRKLTLGVAAKAEADLTPGEQNLNLYPGVQARLFNTEVVQGDQGIWQRNWEVTATAGPALHGVASTGDEGTRVGGFLSVGANVCLDDECRLSGGAEVTTAVYEDQVDVTPAVKGLVRF